MYGSWFGLTFGGIGVIVVLIGLSILASPLIAILIALVVAGIVVGALLARRATASVGASGSQASGPPDRGSFAGGPHGRPRSGGAPVSGEGGPNGGGTGSH